MPSGRFLANSACSLQSDTLILPVVSETLKDATLTFSFRDVVTSRNSGVDTMVASIVIGVSDFKIAVEYNFEGIDWGTKNMVRIDK